MFSGTTSNTLIIVIGCLVAALFVVIIIGIAVYKYRRQTGESRKDIFHEKLIRIRQVLSSARASREGAVTEVVNQDHILVNFQNIADYSLQS